MQFSLNKLITITIIWTRISKFN